MKSVQIRSFFLVRIFLYSVRTQKNTDQKKLYLDTFHAEIVLWKTLVVVAISELVFEVMIAMVPNLPWHVTTKLFNVFKPPYWAYFITLGCPISHWDLSVEMEKSLMENFIFCVVLLIRMHLIKYNILTNIKTRYIRFFYFSFEFPNLFKKSHDMKL